MGADGFPESDHVGPPRRARGQHAIVENQVDARPRCQRGEALEQFHGVKQQMRSAVRPWAPQLEADLAIGRPLEPLLGDGRPQGVAGDALQPVALVRVDADAGVEVETRVPRVARPESGIDGRPREHVAEAANTGAGPRPKRRRPCTEAAARPASTGASSAHPSEDWSLASSASVPGASAINCYSGGQELVAGRGGRQPTRHGARDGADAD